MGGGVLRTATKAGALGGVYRPRFGTSASAAGRRSTVSAPPPSASSAVTDSNPISIHLEESKGLTDSANPTVAQWEKLDDWEFAGWKSEGEDLFDDPPPRLVFSPVPTLEEAREATVDLTKALERAKEHGQMGTFQSNAIIPAMPRGVAQAFSLLQSSSEAQTVVASLASDKNVWDAVMKNQQVMEFCRNHQSFIMENLFEESPETDQNKSEETPSEAVEAPQGNNGFAEVMNNVKVKAMEIVNNISNFIQDMFGTKTETNSSEAGSNSGFESFITPNTFYALAIAVILIVLVKRA